MHTFCCKQEFMWEVDMSFVVLRQSLLVYAAGYFGCYYC